MSATVIVDEGHPANGPLEGGTLPEPRAARILDDHIAPVPTRCADESAAYLEELAKALLLILVMSTRVIGDGFGGAGNTEPEYSDNARACLLYTSPSPRDS